MAKAIKVTEKVIHSQVADYLNLAYKDVVFTSDPSGMRLSMGLRVEAKRKRSAKYKIPDLLILQPNPVYKGLCIEIKTCFEDVYKKDGGLKKSEHLEAQLATIKKLSDLGYAAFFGCGFNECKRIIDHYMQTK